MNPREPTHSHESSTILPSSETKQGSERGEHENPKDNSSPHDGVRSLYTPAQPRNERRKSTSAPSEDLGVNYQIAEQIASILVKVRGKTRVVATEGREALEHNEKLSKRLSELKDDNKNDAEQREQLLHDKAILRVRIRQNKEREASLQRKLAELDEEFCEVSKEAVGQRKDVMVLIYKNQTLREKCFDLHSKQAKKEKKKKREKREPCSRGSQKRDIRNRVRDNHIEKYAKSPLRSDRRRRKQKRARSTLRLHSKFQLDQEDCVSGESNIPHDSKNVAEREKRSNNKARAFTQPNVKSRSTRSQSFDQENIPIVLTKAEKVQKLHKSLNQKMRKFSQRRDIHLQIVKLRRDHGTLLTDVRKLFSDFMEDYAKVCEDIRTGHREYIKWTEMRRAEVQAEVYMELQQVVSRKYIDADPVMESYLHVSSKCMDKPGPNGKPLKGYKKVYVKINLEARSLEIFKDDTKSQSWMSVPISIIEAEWRKMEDKKTFVIDNKTWMEIGRFRCRNERECDIWMERNEVFCKLGYNVL